MDNWEKEKILVEKKYKKTVLKKYKIKNQRLSYAKKISWKITAAVNVQMFVSLYKKVEHSDRSGKPTNKIGGGG